MLIPVELMENADAVIRSQTIHFEVDAPGKATYKEHRVVTLFNDDSYYDRLTIHYDSFNKLGRITGKIYDAMGNLVREIDKKEVRDQSHISGYSIYDDNRVRYVEVNHSDYPFTVEFEFEKTYKHLLHYPTWSVDEYGIAVEQAEVKVSVPANMELYFQGLNIGVDPVISNDGSDHTYLWSLANLKAVKYEPYCPPAMEFLPSIILAPSVFEAEDYTGSMSSWNEFGNFVNKLLDGRDVLSPAMKNTVQELTANAISDQEKIDILYRFMQANMRYVSVQLGIGGWQPFDAQYVETNKYGDCKALSNFMKALLKEAGIPSEPVLIYSGKQPYEIREEFTNPAFNHMILYVPSEDMWLECTSTTSPPNYLGFGTSDRNVLLITESGGQLARTPAMSITDNLEDHIVDIAVDEEGLANVQVSSLLRGIDHDWYRNAKDSYSTEDLKKELTDRISLPSFSLEKFSIEPNHDKPEAAVTFQATVPRYASKAGKRLFVPLNTLNAHSWIPPENDSRQHPIVSKIGYTERDSITFHIPVGFHVESMPPADNKIDSEYGNYSLQISQDQHTLTIKRQLEIRPVQLPAESYNDWRDFHKQIAKMDGAMLVLIGKS